ncbi:DEAD/DEAH box helicase, partial [Pantoea agglomerans]|uniref:DEAD/DEAH box helicase n=1 Tax=Enterobacter agglomerans TaxID=549 RepID=UPI001F5DD6DD
ENQDIVVATTGRLLQYIKEENFDCRAVETLVLDEADRMLDNLFAPRLSFPPFNQKEMQRHPQIVIAMVCMTDRACLGDFNP